MSWARRFAIGALGLSLALLVAATWGTGLFYLAARFGAGSPIRLAIVDGIHIYVGIASVAFFAAKLARVGFRRRVAGVPKLLLWQRWISWSLIVLYAAVYASGVAATLPLSNRNLSLAVNAHLLTSIWAAVPTTWHVWHYRKRTLPYLQRKAPQAAAYWPALAVLLVPLLFVLVAPRALSQIPRAGGGGAWSQAGLGGIFLDRLLATNDNHLLAAGDGLYLSDGRGSWRRVDLPNGGDETATRQIEFGIRPSPAPAPVGVVDHSHAQQPAAGGLILALAADRARSAYYAAGTAALYYSPWAEGPYVALPFPGGEIRDLAIDPNNPYTVWAASEQGPFLSIDGGHTWTSFEAGLGNPGNAWSLTYLHGDLYLSDLTGVFRFAPESTLWTKTGSRTLVTSLRAREGRLYEASAADGAHQHGGHAGLFYAGPDAALAELATGPASHSRDLVRYRGRLFGAGDDGVYSVALEPARAAGLVWWAGLLGLTLVAAAVSVAMIHPRRGSVQGEGRFKRSLKFREENDVSVEAGGRRNDGSLRPSGLLGPEQRVREQHG